LPLLRSRPPRGVMGSGVRSRVPVPPPENSQEARFIKQKTSTLSPRWLSCGHLGFKLAQHSPKIPDEGSRPNFVHMWRPVASAGLQNIVAYCVRYMCLYFSVVCLAPALYHRRWPPGSLKIADLGFKKAPRWPPSWPKMAPHYCHMAPEMFPNGF
jgi:hypothetical protein